MKVDQPWEGDLDLVGTVANEPSLSLGAALPALVGIRYPLGTQTLLLAASARPHALVLLHL